jgi:hypothetical protein
MARLLLYRTAILLTVTGSVHAVTIQVPANTPYPHWFDTGVSVAEGQSLQISASGSWAYGGGPSAWNGPGGNGEYAYGTWLVPAVAPAYSLVGRIGDGPGFAVGYGGTLDASTYGTGELYLAHNDQINGYSDNRGFVTVTIIGGSSEEPVRFNDPNLKAAVEQALGRVNPTPSDMLALTSLYKYEGLSDLTGLEYATNLQALGIGGNGISDLSPLAGLTNLQDLAVLHSSVSDTSPVSGLINLQNLSLLDCPISDVSPLSGLINLELLTLVSCPASDISALSGLINLQGLGLVECSVSDLSPLSGLTNLRTLGIAYCPVSDISSMSGLENLEELTLTGDAISDLSPLSGLTHLVALDLSSNPLNQQACDTYIPLIMANNPGISISYDPCGAQRTLTISATAGGYVATPGGGAFQYADAMNVPIVAQADSGYEFSGWTGTAVDAGKVADSSSAFTDVLMDADYTLVANFKPAGGPEVSPPAPMTQSAVNVGPTSAILQGSITSDGGEASQYRFRYKREGNPYSYTSWTGSVTTGQSFSTAITGLAPGSTYYFNAQAKNSAGESDWGSEETFDTLMASATGTVRGTVYNDAVSTFSAGATVTVGDKPPTQTDSYGRYEVSGVSPGQITIIVSKPGYQTQTKSITVRSGETVTMDFRLLVEGSIVSDTSFTPQTDGFPFENWSDPNDPGDNCVGMSLAALYFHWLSIDIDSNAESTYRGYIRILQKKYGWGWLDLVTKLSSLDPATNSVWVESQYLAIKASIDANVPCVVGLAGTKEQEGHAVVAYKIIEWPIPNGTTHVILVYDSNHPKSGAYFIQVTDLFGLIWSMEKYDSTSYDRFGYYMPFSAGFIAGRERAILEDIILTMQLSCPATLRVKDSDGSIIDYGHSEVEGGYYRVFDLGGDGHEEHVVFFLAPKAGTYTIEVIPDPDANPDATFSLVVTRNGIDEVLADNVKIRDIPEEPYVFEARIFQSDLDNNGMVGVGDLGRIAFWWLRNDCYYPGWCEGADLDYSGAVDLRDYGVFASEWRRIGVDEAQPVEPVAHWTFDEGAGSVAKDLAGSNPGNVYGAKWAEGRVGRALRFDGMDDYVDCGNAAGLAPEKLTVAFWVFVEGRTSYQYVLGKSRDMFSEQDYTFSTGGDGKLEVAFAQDASKRVTVRSKEQMALGQWVYVTGTRDGAAASLYLNGQLEGSAAYSFAVTNKGQSLRIGSIGMPEPEWAGFFKGKLDDVRIYDKVLSAEEIQELYEQVSP